MYGKNAVIHSQDVKTVAGCGPEKSPKDERNWSSWRDKAILAVSACNRSSWFGVIPFE